MDSDRDECPVPTNHFLRDPQPDTWESYKIGPNPRVCTNDMIPIRAHFVPNGGVAWESLFPNAAEVLEKSVDLTMRLLDESRIVMVVGRQAHDTVTRRLEEDPTIEVHKLFVSAHGVTIFREAPHILVVRDRENQEIRNLVFFSHHSQSFWGLLLLRSASGTVPRLLVECGMRNCQSSRRRRRHILPGHVDMPKEVDGRRRGENVRPSSLGHHTAREGEGGRCAS